jgi:hypothetical protein
MTGTSGSAELTNWQLNTRRNRHHRCIHIATCRRQALNPTLLSLSESAATSERRRLLRVPGTSFSRFVDRSSNIFMSITISLVAWLSSLMKSFTLSTTIESDFQSLCSTGRTDSELVAVKIFGWKVEGLHRTAITSGANSL